MKLDITIIVDRENHIKKLMFNNIKSIRQNCVKILPDSNLNEINKSWKK